MKLQAQGPVLVLPLPLTAVNISVHVTNLPTNQGVMLLPQGDAIIRLFHIQDNGELVQSWK